MTFSQERDNISSMNDFVFNIKTPQEVEELVASRIRMIRKRKKMSQVKLSEKSGVSLGSVKRFENTGDISFKSLIKISIALGIENELIDLFRQVPYESIEEVINEQNR